MRGGRGCCSRFDVGVGKRMRECFGEGVGSCFEEGCRRKVAVGGIVRRMAVVVGIVDFEGMVAGVVDRMMRKMEEEVVGMNVIDLAGYRLALRIENCHKG